MKAIPVLLLSLFFISPCIAKSRPDTLSADSIISRSEKAYAHLKTYADSGKLIQTFMGTNPHKSSLIFKTAYVNTGNINFEYYIPGNSNSLYTINRSDSVIKTWWGIMNRTETRPNMVYALGAASGVSSSSSTIIPELLLATEFKNRNLYRYITKRALAGMEHIDGKDCYRITGKDLRGDITIWIAKKDLLIRKIETEYVIDPAKTAALVNKIESRMKNKNDSAAMLRENVRKKIEAINKIDSLSGKKTGQAFTVRSSFLFFPKAGSKIAPVLLTFRPNREVAL